MKSSCLISNTGPLLALSGAGHLDLLYSLYARVLIPDAVDHELRQGGGKSFGLSDYLRAEWIQVHPIPTVDPLLLSQLDKGEAAVIALALKIGSASLLIDERRARKIARTVYVLNVLGTVRILLESKKAGLIEKVDDVLIAMRDNGYWIHEDIVDYALKTAGER